MTGLDQFGPRPMVGLEWMSRNQLHSKLALKGGRGNEMRSCLQRLAIAGAQQIVVLITGIINIIIVICGF